MLEGVEKALQLYDLGRKKLLRKCENKHIPHLVVDTKTDGERIICSNVQESVHFVKYKRSDNQLVVFAGFSLSCHFQLLSPRRHDPPVGDPDLFPGLQHHGHGGQVW